MFVSILDGDDPRTAKPVLMTRDPAVLRAGGDALRERLEEGATGNERERDLRDVLELVRSETGGGDGDEE